MKNALTAIPIASWMYRFKPGHSPLNRNKIIRQNITRATLQPNHPAQFRHLLFTDVDQKPAHK